MNNNQNIAQSIKEALSEVRNLAEAQTIIGEPIKAGNVTIIPVSRVSIGIGIGGGSYGKEGSNGAGGGGTGLTVSPVAFIVIEENGNTKLLNVGADIPGMKISGTVSEIDKALDDVPGIITKVKGIFKKDNGEADTAEEASKE